MRPRRKSTLLIPLLIIFIVAACARSQEQSAKYPEGAFPVDTLFKRFHEKLGGAAIIGNAISPIFDYNGVLYQYTTNALMVFDPSLKGEKFSLAPLGRDMQIYEFPTPHIEDNQAKQVDGYRIDPKFLAVYDRMGGKAVVGKPLTEVHRNVEKARYEQYFENVGFYRIEDDPEEQIYLLAYGAWKCDASCRHAPPENSIISWPSQTAAPFVKAVAKLGLGFTGYALTPPYLSPTGLLEQIYENVILVTDLSHPDYVQLAPLPDKVGIPRDILMPPKLLPDRYFYPVENNLGYNVPVIFMDYLEAHGGFEFAGAPITQDLQLDKSVIRQCFEKICLEAYKEDNGQYIIQPMALGIKYRTLYYKPIGAAPSGDVYADLTVQIWEAYPMVSPEQVQEIIVTVFSNNTPITGLEPELELYLPDGGLEKYVLPPSDSNGESHWMVEPLQAENGTLVPYKVCVATPSSQRFCIRDSYLIWKTEVMAITPKPPAPGYASYLPFIVRNASVYVPAVIEQYFYNYLPLVISSN